MAAGDRSDDPRVFPSQAAFRAWLGKHHQGVAELWVGFYKKATGKAGMTYPEAVDEALCWGWIDGVKKRVDDERFTHRFTPRKAVSKWSDVNLRRYAELEAQGRVAPPGRAAFARFDPSKHRAYSFEARPEALPEELETAFRRSAAAWSFFEAQPPGYRRTAIHWVSEAKREETRLRRLAQLVEVSAAGGRLPMLGG
ncbi:MAG: YdeI/OmpD-associated family protein [Longimicrobiales bacterium]|nr:YdeI/OmpD-associated family protein [Longimicrobiales bacterium]